ncbi:MAG: hypothetical protein AAF628_18670 [Planctomycetota bacterium]
MERSDLSLAGLVVIVVLVGLLGLVWLRSPTHPLAAPITVGGHAVAPPTLPGIDQSARSPDGRWTAFVVAQEGPRGPWFTLHLTAANGEAAALTSRAGARFGPLLWTNVSTLRVPLAAPPVQESIPARALGVAIDVVSVDVP